MTSFRCPSCGAGLQRTEVAHGVMWVCPSCGGRAAGIGLLRRAIAVAFTNDLWNSALAGGVATERRCAVCDQRMLATHTSPEVDVCKACRFVWFDPGEFDLSPPSDTPVASEPLTQEQLEAIGRLGAELIAGRWRDLPDAEIGDEVRERLMMIPGALGMPVEEAAPELRRNPVVTWSLLAAIAIGWAVVGLAGDDITERFGLIPSDAFRYAGLTFVTSFFLHAGLLHAFTNMYFLFVFGDNVEDFLGRSNFVLLIAVAALAGAATHALFSPARDAALVGANGAVSALVVFYGLRFPQARLRYFKLVSWFSMPAVAATGAWALTQFVGARAELTGNGDAPFLASVGGGLVGFCFWFLWRND